MMRLSIQMAVLVCLCGLGTNVLAQSQTLKGAAALAHPAVQEAVKAIDLIKSGKTDEAMARRTASERADWTKMSAADRADLAAALADRTPAARAFADAVRATGELKVNGNSAELAFSIGQARGVAYFDREAGAWHVSNGPMVFPAAPTRGAEVRVEGAAILKHAIWPVASQFLDLVHAGKIEEAQALGTTEGLAKWKSEPPSEKAEIQAYLRKNLPTRAAATAGLETGRGMRGILIVEDDKLATLNFVVTAQTPGSPGSVTASSTTQSMGFEKQNGQWRVRN